MRTFIATRYIESPDGQRSFRAGAVVTAPELGDPAWLEELLQRGLVAPAPSRLERPASRS